MGVTSPDNISYPDATTKVGPLRTVLSSMASSVQAAVTKRAGDVQTWINNEYSLPGPQTAESTTSPLAITATTWTTVSQIPAITLNFSRPAWVQIMMGSWVVCTGAGDIRAGVQLSGATTQAPQDPAWGTTIWQQGINNSSLNASKFVQVAAGSTTFRVQAYQTGAGVKQLNYALMQVVPIRWSSAVSL